MESRTHVCAHSYTNTHVHACKHVLLMINSPGSFSLIRLKFVKKSATYPNPQHYFTKTLSRQYLLSCKSRDNHPIQSEHMNNSITPTSHNFWFDFFFFFFFLKTKKKKLKKFFFFCLQWVKDKGGFILWISFQRKWASWLFHFKLAKSSAVPTKQQWKHTAVTSANCFYIHLLQEF